MEGRKCVFKLCGIRHMAKGPLRYQERNPPYIHTHTHTHQLWSTGWSMYSCYCCLLQSHLFSVGMSMLYAVRYTTETDNPRPMLGNAITDLLGRLTCDEVTKRPDLHEVIRWCDDALQGKSSQDICLNLCSAFIHTTSIQGTRE